MRLRDEIGPLRRRTTAVFVVVFAVLGLLHLRLLQLQLVEGGHWREMAENNRLRRLPVPGIRGRIYDRRGRVLADNAANWDLLLFPDEAAEVGATAAFLDRSGIAERDAVLQALEQRRTGRLAPLLVAEDLSWEQVARVRAHQSDYPELSVVAGFRRVYPFGGTAAHAVGHLRLVSQDELTRRPELDATTLVGAIGIEARFEQLLAGEPGERWVVVSAVGRQQGVVRETAATAGSDLTVTLDIDLQQVAEAALGEEAGAIVALDPTSGAVRALYSAPSFDPNVFVGRLSRADWAALAEDPAHPLQNRCLQGVYPPGSTIKPFLALAGLNSGVIDRHWGTYCSGGVTLYGHLFRCWRRGGHGAVGLERSLEVSCDSFYYLLGQRLGVDRLAEWLRRFGFGQLTGIGLSAESAGLVGTPEWSRTVRGTPWYPGDLVSMSIGQGPVLATVLQLARGYAALANGGRLVTPHVVESRDDAPAPPLELVGLDEVVNGLRLAVAGREGTATSLARLPVAGKTGTAQVVRLQDNVDSSTLEKRFRHHAWFVGWTPLERPQLVVAVLVEHGGGGGGVAAPVAGKVLAAFLDQPAAAATVDGR